MTLSNPRIKYFVLCLCLLIFMVIAGAKALSIDDAKTIYIQPLGSVQKSGINLVKATIEHFYHYKCVVKPQLSFTPDILADSKTRYEANKILAKYNTNDNKLILTEKDIATANPERHIAEWGIFGLGYRPGTTCVVSTFRLRRNASVKLFNSRLTKVCLHEIGHNLGLQHCTSVDKRCFMNDARGSIKVVDEEEVFLCGRCREVIGW